MTPDAFWSRVAIAGPNDCWEWRGFRNERGYGRISNSRRRDGWPRSIRAHRLAYAFHQGIRPGDAHVLHSCDNPPCCNPAHLRLGDAKANAADKVARGRSHTVPLGSKHANSKLTEEAARDIRANYVRGKYGDSSRAARKYGVSKNTVAQLLRGETWAHVQ